MIRKYRKNGVWYAEEVENKTYIFEMESCTDKSKFVPESGDNSQYNGNASGNNPQYDFQDGKMPKGHMLHYVRKVGLDVTELDEAIKMIKQSAHDVAKTVNNDVDMLAQEGVTLDQSVNNSKGV